MKGLWFRVQGSEFRGFRIRRQSAMVPIVEGLIVTTSALLYGSVGWTKKSSTWKVFSVGILEWSWLGFGILVVPNPAKQLQVLLHPRTVPLLYYYCNTTVLPLYYYRHTAVLLHYCNTIVLLLYYYCTTTVLLLLLLLLYYYCTTTVLHTTAPHQASDVVDCGGEYRLEGKVFRVKGFQFW